MKFKTSIALCFFIGLLLMPCGLRASHIAGGELQVVYVSPERYLLRAIVYFDELNANPGALDRVAVVSLFDKQTDKFLDYFELPLTVNEPVAFSNSECAQVGAVKTSRIVYELNVKLPATKFSGPEGFYLVWERCCRTGLLSNLDEPARTGTALYAEFPPLLINDKEFINSSPQFSELKGDFACANSYFELNYAATDADGDRLVYRLISPTRGRSTFIDVAPVGYPGPYPSVTWLPGFDSANATPAPVPLQLDTLTGIVSFASAQPGIYAFAMACDEYRSGVKIGEVRREYQVIVTDNCPVNQPPSITPSLPDFTSISLLNDTLTMEGTQACLGFQLSDPDSGTNYRVRYLQRPVKTTSMLMPDTTWGAEDSTLTTLCFNHCTASPVASVFTLLVADNGCATGTDTLSFVFINPDVNNAPVLTQLDELPDTVQAYTTTTVKWLIHDPDGDRLTFAGGTIKKGGLLMNILANDSILLTWTWAPDCADINKSWEALNLKIIEKTCPQQSVLMQLETPWTIDTVQDLTPDYVANIVTPNGDGINDLFVIKGIKIGGCGNEFMGVRLVNRWGSELFFEANREINRDLSRLPDGIYFYVIEYSGGKNYKGWVQVLK